MARRLATLIPRLRIDASVVTPRRRPSSCANWGGDWAEAGFDEVPLRVEHPQAAGQPGRSHGLACCLAIFSIILSIFLSVSEAIGA